MARRRRSGRWAVGSAVVLVLGALGYKYGPWGTGTFGRHPDQDMTLMGQTGGRGESDKPPLREISDSQGKTSRSDAQDKAAEESAGDNPAEPLASLGKPATAGESLRETAGGDRAGSSPPSDAVAGYVEAGEAAMRKQKWLQARTKLTQALHKLPETAGPAGSDVQRDNIISKLEKVADTVTFSPRVLPDDPTTDRHTVQPGESLVVIARKYGVTPDLLARINRLPDKNRIQAGQTLKVVQGPFRAVVYKKRFELEVYLGDILVRRFRVGLGENGGTPTGQWRVQNKLVNPTYYPPRGGKLIHADDPENPLGERWIGLEGIDGDAVGKKKYGIHGTIEPDSIGKNLSMGCVRLLNHDVEELYELLIPDSSLVEIMP